ncbi:lipid transferase CIDEB-like isoform X2 [Calonectris borealis]|uniref:lipid transferase CIDEB-like isoform X2 n=1 Tax=Calonectris borealis TaxID=1323832 RepID=UPI003F4B31C3
MDVLRAVARRAWSPPAPQPRPFWVCDQRRGRPRGLVAASLEELREQAGEALSLRPRVTLVLAEDGTAVETEGFSGRWRPTPFSWPWRRGSTGSPPRPGCSQSAGSPRCPGGPARGRRRWPG